MSRLFAGVEALLKRARQRSCSDCTLEYFHQAQAVQLPLDHAMSLTATAAIIGVSPEWACQSRRCFILSPRLAAPMQRARGTKASKHELLKATLALSTLSSLGLGLLGY